MTELLETAFRDYLVSDGAIADLVSDRVMPLRLEEGTYLPAIAYQRISARREYTFDPFPDTSAYVRARMQVSCWDASALGAWRVGEAVLLALSGFSGMWGSILIGSVFIDLELDDYEPQTKMYRRIIDAIVSYEDARSGSLSGS